MLIASIVSCAAVVHAGVTASHAVSESVINGVPLWESETVAAELTGQVTTDTIREAVGKVARSAAEAEGTDFCHVFHVHVKEHEHCAHRSLAVARVRSTDDHRQQIQDGFVKASDALREYLSTSECDEYQEFYPERDIDDVRRAAAESAVFHGATRLADDSVVVVVGTGVDVLATRWKAAKRLFVVAGDLGRWQSEQEILARASWGLLSSGDWVVLADAANRDQIILYGVGAELAANPEDWTAEPRATAYDAVERLAIADDLTNSFSEQWRGVASNVEQVIENSCLPGVDLLSLKFGPPPQAIHFHVVHADELPPREDPLLLMPVHLCLASVYLRQEHARDHAPSAREAIRQGLSEIYAELETNGGWVLKASGE